MSKTFTRVMAAIVLAVLLVQNMALPSQAVSDSTTSTTIVLEDAEIPGSEKFPIHDMNPGDIISKSFEVSALHNRAAVLFFYADIQSGSDTNGKDKIWITVEANGTQCYNGFLSEMTALEYTLDQSSASVAYTVTICAPVGEKLDLTSENIELTWRYVNIAETDKEQAQETVAEHDMNQDPAVDETTPEQAVEEETQPEEVVEEEYVPPYTAIVDHDIPLYYQTDYPNNRYGAGTIKSSGCGITCLAMVATYMTGHEYLPDELARWFGGHAENNMIRMEMGATALGLPWYKAENINVATDALMNGKIGIFLMEGYKGQTAFTSGQHFIVVRGMTEDGKFLIQDPNKPNYDKWQLKAGFEKGFTRNEVLAGYSGAWIFDPDSMPEDFEPYHKEEYPRQDNYPGVELTFEEQELICELIWAEARGECAEGQQAVAEVVLNRLSSGKFAQSIAGIITPAQFNGVKVMDKAEPWQAQYDALEAARYGKLVLDKDVYYFGTSPHNENIYKKIGGHIFCYADSD